MLRSSEEEESLSSKEGEQSCEPTSLDSLDIKGMMVPLIMPINHKKFIDEIFSKEKFNK